MITSFIIHYPEPGSRAREIVNLSKITICDHIPLSESLGRRERIDHDVVPVRISKCKLQSPCVRLQVWLLFEPSNESPRSRQSHVKLVHTEKQEQAVAGLPVIGARQGGMLVGTPQVETEQDRAIRVADLPEV
jgi:hypothetical protein